MAIYDLTGSTRTHILMYDNLGSNAKDREGKDPAARIQVDEAGKVAREILMYLTAAEIKDVINDGLLRLSIGNHRGGSYA